MRDKGKIEILASSEFLARELLSIDVYKNRPSVVSRGENKLIIYAAGKWHEIPVGSIEGQNELRQDDRRWDWILDTLLKVPDQPVILEITEKVVNVIFQY